MEFSGKFLNLLLGFRREKDPGDEERLEDLYKKALSIAWPAALEGLLMTLMNSFDTMMVGKLGSAAITSVGLCAQPRMIMLLLAQSLCVGTTAVVARRKGEDDQDAALSCLKQSLALITGLGILMTVLGYFLASPLLQLAGAGEDTLPDGILYFRAISMAFIPNCWALCICAAMRGIGKTKVTMVVNMTANVVNVLMNYCLIGGHLGFPAWGVRGAGIATAIGTCTSCIIALYMVLKKGGYLSLVPFTGFSFDKKTMKSLVSVGSGSIAESVFMRVGFLLNGKLIAGISTAAYATTQIVQQVSSLTFCLGDGVSSACTSLVGQSLGARQPKKAMTYVKVGERISIFMSVFIMLFAFFGRFWLPTLFSEEKEVIQSAAVCFLVLLAGIYPQNMRVMIAGCLRGAGDVKYVALVSLISVAIMRPLLTWFFSYPMNSWLPGLMFGYIGAWISFDVDAVLRWVLLQIRCNKGEWVNIKL
ncbi:MAG: MATE family efflux transporter [Lachnospiraceae bacterium]|nr:MATE family efflux transporter [Lachnospiraceae bacterium]